MNVKILRTIGLLAIVLILFGLLLWRDISLPLCGIGIMMLGILLLYFINRKR